MSKLEPHYLDGRSSLGLGYQTIVEFDKKDGSGMSQLIVEPEADESIKDFSRALGLVVSSLKLVNHVSPIMKRI